MGTEVLRPQDCLGERFGRVCQPVFHRRKSSFANGNGIGNVRTNNFGYRKQLNRPERLDTRRKPAAQPTSTDQQFHGTPRRTSSAFELENHFNKSPNHKHQQKGVEMGRVTILRRGQSLDSFETKMKKETNNTTSSSKIKGGNIMKNKFNMDGSFGDSLYAGSAFAVSPAPESLPLPSFFNSTAPSRKGFEYDDFASRDLRRLLRLE